MGKNMVPLLIVIVLLSLTILLINIVVYRQGQTLIISQQQEGFSILQQREDAPVREEVPFENEGPAVSEEVEEEDEDEVIAGPLLN